MIYVSISTNLPSNPPLSDDDNRSSVQKVVFNFVLYIALYDKRSLEAA
jgi:hypothetical protein